MKIINLGRGQGKTVRLLYASEWSNTPILCANHQYKDNLIHMAKRLGLKIPEPIITSDFFSNKLNGNCIRDKDILIDDSPEVLKQLLKHLGIGGEIKAITLTSDELIDDLK